MKEWGEEIAASSECQKGCPKEQICEWITLGLKLEEEKE
jgi:hypothetical protein